MTVLRTVALESQTLDIDGEKAIREVAGKDLNNILPIIITDGLLTGESYDGFILDQNLITGFITYRFFLQGEEQFSITAGYNSDKDMGALKTVAGSEIIQLFFVQGANLGLEPAGTLMGAFFAVGGANVVFSILQDSSGFFSLINNNQLVSQIPIPEGTYALVIKAEGTGTQYVDQITVIVLATALISNINLSNVIVEEGAPIGTNVGALTTTGGEPPITFTIVSQTLGDSSGPVVDIFEIVGSDLKTKAAVGITGVTYSVFIKAEDSRLILPDDSRIRVEEFIIDVVADSFINSNSLIFDGVDESLEIADHISLWGNQNFSGSFWVKPNNIGDVQYIASQFREAGKRAWGLRVNSGGEVAVVYSQTGTTADTTTTASTITFASWNHVAFAFDGTLATPKMKIWINGTLSVDEDTTLTSLFNTDVPMYIGALGDFILSLQAQADHFDGNIDESALYNITLNQSQVDEIYNSGAPTNLASLSSGGNIISWWRMGDFFTGVMDPDEVGSNDATGISINNSNKSTDVPT